MDFEAKHLSVVETPVPLSAISFCSALLHKKDAAAIGAIMETSVFHCNGAKKILLNTPIGANLKASVFHCNESKITISF